MHIRDKRRGRYRLEQIVSSAAIAIALLLPSVNSLHAQSARQREATNAQTNPERLRVMFLGDNGHHRPTQRAQQLLPALARNGIDLFYTDDLNDLSPEKLSQYHVIALYNNHTSVSRDQMHALSQFVEQGRGLVVLHSASASFQNSEEFIRLVGGAFKSHGAGIFNTERTVAGETHSVTVGVPLFESWDESYIHTKHNPVNRIVLEVRKESGHEEPYTWVRTHGKGRVFYTAWGHDQRTWGNEGFQQLVGQAIRWTAGDWALTAVARDPETRLVDLEVPLPTYKRPPAPWNVLDSAITKAQAALTTDASIQMMTVPPGFKVLPFATEPMIGNIIDFTWDERGRMWAVETQDYPNNVLPDSVAGNDRVLILEDNNGDGLADNVKVFASGLNLATSIVIANGGVIVGQAPHMLFFRDTNGDDKADERRILFSGWPRTDTHGTISNLRYGFDNQVWGSVGYNGFRGTVGKSNYLQRGSFGAGYFRMPSDGSDLDYIARTSNNTWGLGLTEDGYIFGSTANSRPSNFVHIPGRYYRAAGLRDTILPGIADRLDVFPQIDILQVDQFGRYTAGAAHEIYTARDFPKSYWNRTAFVAEPTAHVIGMFDLSDAGSGFRAKNRWSFMSARDAWVAPVQVKVGPDGALWVSDFYTLVAQHNPTPRDMQGCCETGKGQAYETPNRDRLHGRIYKIAYSKSGTTSATSNSRFRLDGKKPTELVAALTNDNMFWRMTAQRLLVEGKHTSAIPALVAMASNHTVDALGLNPSVLHALWTLHGLNAIAAEGTTSEGTTSERTSSEALTAARLALRHPASSVRRAALQLLPRTSQLESDIFEAGILPDRRSPWPVDYTVPTAVLQDADAHVRLEALLALSELEASERIAAAITDVVSASDNMRDAWIPEGAALAAIKQGPRFLESLLRIRIPTNDSLAANGIKRVVQKVAQAHSLSASSTNVVSILLALPNAASPLAVAAVNGITLGWPEEQPPELSATQRQALSAMARGASPEVSAALQTLAERWTLPDIFRVQQ